MSLKSLLGLIAAVTLVAACGGGGGSSSGGGAPDGGGNGGDPRLSGGQTTIFNATSEAFEQPAPNLSAAQQAKHAAGDARFDVQFVSAGNDVHPGLGPIFNADSCGACHIKNGRGRPVDDSGQTTEQIQIRASLPTADGDSAPYPLQNFGLQLQTDATFGVTPEVKVKIQYQSIDGQYSDGEPYTLVAPHYIFEQPYVPLPADFEYSPRVAPPVFGRGLLEAIPPERLEQLADPMDANGDGISGEIQRVTNMETGATGVIGRFGHKAGQPTIRQQVASAYQDDMGVTNPARPEESSNGQNQDDMRTDDPEISEEILEQTAFYIATLAVPARRDVDNPQVRRGEALFTTSISAGGLGCAACHTQTLRTASGAPLEALLSVSFPDDGPNPLADQVVHPYTDLLLHDMGPGLADG
ncbi:MAG: hypothetical protein L0H19_03160, partial [Salinisphaera sp.]|nr:hypothetical protein [Salinisphaera sp.]